MNNLQFIGKIGDGEFGEVYKAQSWDSHHIYCIKIIDLAKVSQIGLYPTREIQNLQNLRHPNISAYCGHTIFQNKLYLATEFVEGITLSKYLETRKPPLEEIFIRNILLQLVSSIMYCHQQNIIHRDIKLDNIMITQTGCIKLIEFGFSFKLLPNQIAKSYAGTINYMSPEISKNIPYSFQTDVWSLGCVLFQLMTFKNPFGNSATEIAVNIENGKMAPICFPFSDSLKSLVKSMLVTDPACRITLKKL